MERAVQGMAVQRRGSKSCCFGLLLGSFSWSHRGSPRFATGVMLFCPGGSRRPPRFNNVISGGKNAAFVLERKWCEEGGRERGLLEATVGQRENPGEGQR